jgi:stage III sporulation protein AE
MMKIVVLVYLIAGILFSWGQSFAQQIEDEQSFSDEKISFIDPQINYIQKMIQREVQEETIQEVFPDFNTQSFLKDLTKGKIPINFSEIGKRILKFFFNELFISFKLGMKVIAGILIISLIGVLKNSFANTKIDDIAFFCGYATIAVMLYNVVGVGLDMTKDVVENASNFIYASFPIMIVLMTSAGGFATGGLLQPFYVFSFTLLFSLLKNLIFPFILFQVAIAFIANFTSKISLKEIGGFIRQITLWLMGIFLTLFVGVLSLQGSLGYSIDNMTAKTAKLAITSSIPFAGKYISDASETILGYTLLLRNSAGVFVMIVIAGMSLIPIVRMIAWCLFFKVLTVVSYTLPDKRFAGLLDDIAGVFLMLAGVIAILVVVFYIAISFLIGTGRFY